VNGGGKGKPNKPKDPRQKTQTTFELLKVVKYYLQLHYTRYVCKWDTGGGELLRGGTKNTQRIKQMLILTKNIIILLFISLRIYLEDE
jgi:hypothetical protein